MRYLLILPFVILFHIQHLAQGNLAITVKNIGHDHGVVRACLFKSPGTYLGKADVCIEKDAKEGSMILEFKELPDAKYALVVYHDENANGRIDTGLFRIPIEPYGFPGNPSTFFGPPSFERATIRITQSTLLTIKL